MIYISLSLYIYIYTYIHTHTYIHAYVYMYVCVYISLSLSLYIYIYIVYIYICIYIYTYIDNICKVSIERRGQIAVGCEDQVVYATVLCPAFGGPMRLSRPRRTCTRTHVQQIRTRMCTDSTDLCIHTHIYVYAALVQTHGRLCATLRVSSAVVCRTPRQRLYICMYIYIYIYYNSLTIAIIEHNLNNILYLPTYNIIYLNLPRQRHPSTNNDDVTTTDFRSGAMSYKQIAGTITCLFVFTWLQYMSAYS